jgi:hypothetical protein
MPRSREGKWNKCIIEKKRRKLHIIIVAEDIPWGGEGGDRVQENKNLFFPSEASFASALYIASLYLLFLCELW